MNHSQIISQKGAAEIASRVGVPPAHVRVWKHRCIPRSKYADIITAFPDITLDMLRSGEAANDASPQSEAA